MALLALIMSVSYVLVVFVVEPALLQRRTGRSAWLPTWGATGWERAANGAFLLGCGLGRAVPADP